MAQPHVISVILNYHRPQDTLECLASLAESAYHSHSVIVLDCGSTDGSVEAIQAAFPDAQVVTLATNLGYAGNNNVGIEAALGQGADWIFLLNEDTVLAPGALSELVRVGESNPRIGIVGPMVYHYREPNVIQSAGGLLGAYWQPIHLARDQVDQGQYVEPHQVDWISGCAIMIRRAVIEQVGSLDERFFCYQEEAEWCLRSRRGGWRVVHVPQAKLWHKGAVLNDRPEPYVTYYMTRNGLLLMAKHRAPLKAWLWQWGQILRTLASWTVKPKWKPMHEHRSAMWYGLIDFLRRRWGQMPQQVVDR